MVDFIYCFDWNARPTLSQSRVLSCPNFYPLEHYCISLVKRDVISYWYEYNYLSPQHGPMTIASLRKVFEAGADLTNCACVTGHVTILRPRVTDYTCEDHLS